MTEGNTSPEYAQEEDLNVLLRIFETEMRIARGARINYPNDKPYELRNKEGIDINTVRVTRPGSYDETPDTYTLVVIKPKNIKEPVITRIEKTWRAYNPGVDVENYRQEVVFSTKAKIIGGIHNFYVGLPRKKNFYFNAAPNRLTQILN